MSRKKDGVVTLFPPLEALRHIWMTYNQWRSPLDGLLSHMWRLGWVSGASIFGSLSKKVAAHLRHLVYATAYIAILCKSEIYVNVLHWSIFYIWCHFVVLLAVIFMG